MCALICLIVCFCGPHTQVKSRIKLFVFFSPLIRKAAASSPYAIHCCLLRIYTFFFCPWKKYCVYSAKACAVLEKPSS